MAEEDPRDAAPAAPPETPPDPASDAPAEASPAPAPDQADAPAAAGVEPGAGEDADAAPPAPATDTAPPEASKGGGTAAPHAPADDGPPPAAWGAPIVAFDAKWTAFEKGLATVVLVLQVSVLTLWVALKGFSAQYNPTDAVPNKAGIVFRALFGATVLGTVTWLALKKQPHRVRSIATTAAVIVAVLGARSWAHVGVAWGSNLLNWYQQASTLTLLGGLRGVGTRLTMLLTLLGGSLATAAGKHITIDVVSRYLSPVTRLRATVVGWTGTSLICFAASWGFLDHIAVSEFNTPKDASVGTKLGAVTHHIGESFWILRKQISLDLKSFGHVVGGERYSNWMTGKEWNEWIDDSGFVERFGKEKVEAIRARTQDETKTPIVVIPGKGEPRGELIKTADLVYPFGLFIIAVRFLILSLLTLSGHRKLDEGHLDVGIEPKADPTAAKEAA